MAAKGGGGTVEAICMAETLREWADTEETASAEAEQENLEALKEDQKENWSKYINIPDCPPSLQPAFASIYYARQKIKQGNSMEMYYFMNWGHALAKTSTVALDDESLILSTDPTMGDIKWIPANTKWDASVVTLDQDLITEDLSITIPRFVEAVTVANWPHNRLKCWRSSEASLWCMIITTLRIQLMSKPSSTIRQSKGLHDMMPLPMSEVPKT